MCITPVEKPVETAAKILQCRCWLRACHVGCRQDRGLREPVQHLIVGLDMGGPWWSSGACAPSGSARFLCGPKRGRDCPALQARLRAGCHGLGRSGPSPPGSLIGLSNPDCTRCRSRRPGRFPLHGALVGSARGPCRKKARRHVPGGWVRSRFSPAGGMWFVEGIGRVHPPVPLLRPPACYGAGRFPESLRCCCGRRSSRQCPVSSVPGAKSYKPCHGSREAARRAPTHSPTLQPPRLCA